MKKSTLFFLTIIVTSLLIVCYSFAVENKISESQTTTNSQESIESIKTELESLKSIMFRNVSDNDKAKEVVDKFIEKVNDKVDKLEKSLWQRSLDDAKIAVEASKTAITLVSVASFIFMIVSSVLAIFGFREWRNISKLRKKAEREINYVKHFASAEMYMRNNIIFGAIKEYEEVLKIEPNNLTALTQLGFLYSDIDKDKAIKYSKKAVELDKNNFVSYLNWGVNLSHTDAPKKDVIDVYKKAETVGLAQKVDDISMGKVKMFMGHCLKDLEDWQSALDKYMEAKEKFDNAKKSGIPEVVRAAEWWLMELNRSIDEVKKHLKK